LWRHGISGDRPIALVRVAESEELPLVRQLLVAHTYWRLKGLEVDLVILNEHPTGYFEEFHHQLQDLTRTSDAPTMIDNTPGVLLRKAAHIVDEDKVLLQAFARVVLTGERGSLAAQVDRLEPAALLPGRLVGKRRRTDRDGRPRGKGLTRVDLLFA